MHPARPKRAKKMLLVATVGLASMTIDGCRTTSGNLIAPPPIDSGTDTGVDAGNDAGAADAEGADAAGAD